MPKAGVLSLTQYSIHEEMNLKKLYLMYDKILINPLFLEVARQAKDPIPEHLIPLVMGSVRPGQIPIWGDIMNMQGDDLHEENFRSINYLKEINFIELVDYKKITQLRTKTDSDYSGFVEGLIAGRKEKWNSSDREYFEYIQDANTRATTLLYECDDEYRTIPILQHPPTDTPQGRDTKVFQLLLRQLPEPDDSVSWEQLLDFKNDPSTMASYYAFGDWMNEVSKKEYSLHEIEDKFNYLYHQYDQQFTIHNVKAKRGYLELFITGTLDALSGKLGKGLGTSLFSIFRKDLNLLEEETKFPGREVAYIHKANQKFLKSST